MALALSESQEALRSYLFIQDYESDLKEAIRTFGSGFFVDESDHISFVSLSEGRLTLLNIDFLSGKNAYRRARGGGRGQAIAKACGLKGAGPWQPSVLDATAGLGSDAFVLASLGCKVLMLERHPVPYLLLTDAVQRLRASETSIALGLHSLGYELSELRDTFDLVYLDPMYESVGKKASPKAGKGLQILQQEVGRDEDANALLEPALARAKYRVIVKRAKSAPFLSSRKPTRSLVGKSTRFDLYCLQSPPG